MFSSRSSHSTSMHTSISLSPVRYASIAGSTNIALLSIAWCVFCTTYPFTTLSLLYLHSVPRASGRERGEQPERLSLSTRVGDGRDANALAVNLSERRPTSSPYADDEVAVRDNTSAFSLTGQSAAWYFRGCRSLRLFWGGCCRKQVYERKKLPRGRRGLLLLAPTNVQRATNSLAFG